MSYDAEIRVGTKVDTSQMQKLQLKIDDATDKVAQLSKRLDELKSKKAPTEEYKQLQENLYAAKYQAEQLAEAIEKMPKTDVDEQMRKLAEQDERVYKQILSINEELAKPIPERKSGLYEELMEARNELYVIDNARQAILNGFSDADILTRDYEKAQEAVKNVEKEIENLKQVGKDFTLDINTDEISQAEQELNRAQAELRILTTQQDELIAKQQNGTIGFKKIANSAKKAFAAMNSGAKKTNSLLTTMGTRFKGLALSLLIFNQISKAFNAMVQGIKDGFRNISKYSDEYNRNMSDLISVNEQLKNSLATAFEPLVNTVIPYLVSFINMLSEAASKVAELMAAISGKSTFTKAIKIQKDYQDELGNTGSAAKEAQGALAGFDKLNVVKQSEGSGGASAAETKFEEVPVDNKVVEWVENIKKALKEIAAIFKQGFFDGLGDWESRIQDIRVKTQMIKEALADIFTDKAVVSGAKEFAEAFIYNLGKIAGSVTSIGLTIAQNLIGGLAMYLTENTDRIKDYLIAMFDIGKDIMNLAGTFAEAFAYVFEAFGSENGQKVTENIIGIFADAFMGVTELCLKWKRDVGNMLLLPFIENKDAIRSALEGLLGVAATIFASLKDAVDETFDKINEAYDSHFKPFFDSIASGISYLVGKFLEFWNGTVQPILDSWGSKFSELVQQHIQPAIDMAVELIGSLADTLQVLWQQYLVPIIDWVIQNILPVLMPIINSIYSTVVNCISAIADTISGLIEILKGIVDFVVGVLTGDWDRAWNGMTGIVTGAMDAIKGIINFALSLIGGIVDTGLNKISAVFQTVLNGIKSLVKTIFNAISNTISSILGTIKAGNERSLNKIKSTWNNCFNSIKDTVVSVFKTIIDTIFGAIEDITDAFDKLKETIGKVWDGIKGTVGKITSASAGTSTNAAGVSAMTSLKNANIPQLATGSVIRGGNPFVAVLGDQPAGQTNVEAPLSTIKQALKEAMRENGGNGGEYTFVAQLNGKTLYKETVRQDQLFKKSTGKSRFAY